MARWVSAIAGTVAAVVAGAVILRQRKKKWHDGPGWAELLRRYDKYLSQYLASEDCRVMNLKSRFGTTRVYACGSERNPPVFLFHGSNESALLFAKWLIPTLTKKYHVLAFDTIGDMGRSYPKDGKAFNLPNSEEQAVEWFLSLKSELKLLGKPVSLVGYSYGSFLSSLFVKSAPKEVGKVVLLAPAGVFAPIQGDRGWLILRWIFYTVLQVIPWWTTKETLAEGVLKAMMHDPEDSSCSKEEGEELPYPLWDYRIAWCLVDQCCKLIAGKPHAWSLAELKRIHQSTPLLLCIAEHEVVDDCTAAVESARQAGIPYKTFPNASHLMWHEGHGATLAKDVIDFLDGATVEGATYP